MAADPISLLLLSTCLFACWPCFLPCCLAFPVMPCPLLIIHSRHTNIPCEKTDACYYYLYLKTSEIMPKKPKRPPNEKCSQ